MKVSVIIPTKNEPLINELVSQLNEEIAEYDHEVIVVDKSKVPPKLKGAKLLIQKSDGLGNAFMEGVAVSKGDAILLMDGDLSHSPKDVPKLLDALKDSDIVIGSKYMKGGATKDPFYRVIISICSTVFANVILGLGLSDSMSGFCAVRKKVVQSLSLNPKGFKIVLEMVYKSKGKFRVSEVPISFGRRSAGYSKATLKEMWNLLSLIARLRFTGK